MDASMDVSVFSCGDSDLDEFFCRDAMLYSKQMLGKTYVVTTNTEPYKLIAMFTLSNDSIKSALIPKSSRNKIQRKIPNSKRTRSYPAVLIGRLGVSQTFHGLKIGSQILDYLKYLFAKDSNLTGCRFLVVDAYNHVRTLNFYEQNGFQFLYETEDLERKAYNISEDESLYSRMMYYDLMRIKDKL